MGLGDSTTAGTPGFQSPIEAPPDGAGDITSQYAFWMMKSRPDWMVLNRGVNGERSDQIRARFARDVVGARKTTPVPVLPVFAIIIAGVNDIYQGRSPESVQRELDAMYRAARDAAIPTIAGSIIPYNTATPDANRRMRAVNDWIRAYAASDTNVLFCDTRAAVAAPGSPDRLVSSPDDLHPSPDGYRRMAAALEVAVEELMARLK